MKKVFYFSAILISIMSCQTQQSQSEKVDSTTVAQVPMVGGDQDKHGCKGSAGYTWSTVKNNCIRVFEQGVRLNPQDSTLNQTVSAFVVFANETNENEGEVELFLPTLSDSSLLLKPIKDNGAGSWSNGTYVLTQWKGMYTLEENKKALYQGSRQ